MTPLSLPQAHEQLRRMFDQRFSTSLSNWAQFAACFRLHRFSEGEHWIQAGDVAEDICFIAQGLLRIYYSDQNGHEVNQHFYQSDDLIAPVSTMLNNEPCQYYVQALAPSQVLLANVNALSALGYDNPDWLRLENKILQSVFMKTAKREAKLLLGNGEQRYRWFLKEHPELAQQLPQYHIASFLGLTPVSLSRLRKKIQ